MRENRNFEVGYDCAAASRELMSLAPDPAPTAYLPTNSARRAGFRMGSKWDGNLPFERVESQRGNTLCGPTWRLLVRREYER